LDIPVAEGFMKLVDDLVKHGGWDFFSILVERVDDRVPLAPWHAAFGNLIA
jgi:hypothetical protein